MKTIKNTILCIWLVLALLLPSHFRAEVTDRIVAIVNGGIITLYELNTSIKNLTGMDAGQLREKDEENFHKVSRAVLNSMINELIADQHASKLGIMVAEKDVEEAIERVKIDNELTQEDLIYSLKKRELPLRVIKKGLSRKLNKPDW